MLLSTTYMRFAASFVSGAVRLALLAIRLNLLRGESAGDVEWPNEEEVEDGKSAVDSTGSAAPQAATGKEKDDIRGERHYAKENARPSLGGHIASEKHSLATHHGEHCAQL